MSEPSKTDALAMVATGLAEAQAAIRSHPAKTISIYEKCLQAYRDGQTGVTEPPQLRSLDLSLEEYWSVDQYLLTMAFMSAWYHLHGDKVRRDTAAQSAATLASGVGLEAEGAFKAVLRYETMWRNAFEHEGVGRSAPAGCASVAFLVCAVGAVVAFRY